MDSHLLGRRLAAISGVAAFFAMGALTAACAKEEKKAPETTTTTTTTATTTSAPAPAPAPTPAPTEKSINPTGGNLFTPPVVAPPAPTVPPGQHPGIGGIP
jgi:type IV secretory pathway VirB10-like protein